MHNKKTGEKLNAMAKILINPIGENEQVKPKDVLMQEVIRAGFDEETEPSKMMNWIKTAEAYGYFELAVEMNKDYEIDMNYRPVTFFSALPQFDHF